MSKEGKICHNLQLLQGAQEENKIRNSSTLKGVVYDSNPTHFSNQKTVYLCWSDSSCRRLRSSFSAAFSSMVCNHCSKCSLSLCSLQHIYSMNAGMHMMQTHVCPIHCILKWWHREKMVLLQNTRQTSENKLNLSGCVLFLNLQRLNFLDCLCSKLVSCLSNVCKKLQSQAVLRKQSAFYINWPVFKALLYVFSCNEWTECHRQPEDVGK